MLATLTATSSPAMPQASDLGFLLHKHPDRVQTLEVAGGTAHVLWPHVNEHEATMALLLEVDPIALVRGSGGDGAGGGRKGSGPLAQYVNDRPYAASSLLAVALARAFRTAMAGRCEARPDLVGAVLPLQVHLPALPSRGGPDLVERLFAPLGWQVRATPIPLDPQVPTWGDSPYVDAHLSGTLRLADALAHLYVLLPALDDAQHYWVAQGEVDKLLRTGGAWLAAHPERELVTRRYLRHQRDLAADATARLVELEGLPPEPVPEPGPEGERESAPEASVPLVHLRREAVLAALREEGAARVVDLGCGEGALLRELIADPSFTAVIGADVSARALDVAARRLGLDRMPDTQRARLQLLQTSATYRDDRLAGADAVVLMEVVEHLDLPRLPALARSVFASARPTSVVVTTPNAEHNVRYPTLAAGAMRHPDHRFEWTRVQFAAWAQGVAAAHGYAVRYLPIGDDDPAVGPPTQMAVFRRAS